MKSDPSKTKAELIRELKSLRKRANTQDIGERKRAGKSLEENETRFRTLSESAFEAIAIHDKGIIQDVNSTYCKLFMYDYEEIIGMNVLDFAAPESQELVLKNVQRGYGKPYEAFGLRKDGSTFIGELIGKSIPYQGRTARVTIIRDITSRKEAEENLKKSEERYRLLSNEFETIFDNLPALVFYKDTDNRFIRVNKYIADAYEMTKNELEGANLFDLHSKDEAQAYWNDDLDVINSGKAKLDIEESWETAEGLKWVKTSKIPFMDENGNIIGIIGISLDITEHKRAAENLKANTAILEESQRVANLGSYRLDITTGIWTSSGILDEVFGIDKDYKRDTNGWIEIVHPDEQLEMQDYFTNHVIADRQHFDKEYRIIRKNDQKERWVQGLGKLDFDGDGKPIKMIGTIQDITKRKQAEAVKASIYRISEAVHSAHNLESLFSLIHDIVGKLMSAKNFYIALYDPDAEIISFPYFVDEYDKPPVGKKPGKGLTEYVLRTGRPLLASPEVFEELIKKGEVEEIGTPSIDWLGVPLKTENKTIGVLVLQSYTEGVRFSEEDKNILTFVSEQVAMTIERKRVEDKLNQQTLQREKLLETARSLTTNLDIEMVWKQISKEIRTLLRCNGVTIYILEDQDRILKPILAYDPPYAKHVLAAKLDVNNSLTGQAVKAKTGMIFNYAEQESGSYHIPGTPVNREDHVLVMPFIIEGKVIGAIFIYRRQELFTDEDLALVETFSLYASTAINNAQLHQELIDQIEVRKKSEIQLKKAKEYSQNLIDTSMDMIVSVDLKRRIQEFNPAAEKAFGYQRDEILGKHVNILYANKNEGRDIHKTTVEVGNQVTEILNKRKNGEYFHSLLESSVLKDSKGNLVGVMGVSRDISKELAAQKAIKESEKKFRSVIEQSNDGIYVLRKDRFVFINPRFSKLTGYTIEELSHSDFKYKSLFTEKGFDVIKDREERISRGKKLPGRFTFEGVHKNGRIRIWEVNVTEIEWDGNKATLGILQDVTNRIKARKKLEAALEEAHNANEVKNLFLANMSHEIRTPLNTILGFTDLIEDSIRNVVGEEERKFFNVIKTSGERLMHTVHEVLDISQIEAGAYIMKIEDFNLIPMVQELVDGMQIMAEEKEIKLEFHSTFKQVLIRADRDGICQSINNIIDNAIKYTEKGKISIDLKQKSKRSILTIQDTGIGMSQEYLDKIFEAFSQESEGYTKKFQGIGLGMSIVKRHLDLNQVDIAVDSSQERGTTFILTFPDPEKINIQNIEAKKSKKDGSS